MFFYLIGIIITFFLAVLLVTKKKKSKPDWILSVWLIVIGIHLLEYYLFISRQYFEFPYFLGFDRPHPLLHGPFLYVYTSYSTEQPVKGKYPLLHFLPWLLMHIPLIPFLLLPLSEKIEIYKNGGAGYETMTQILVWTIMASGIVYVVLSLLLLKKHQRHIEQEFSDIHKINLAWLRYLILGIGCIWLLVMVGEDTLVFGSVVVFVFFLGYFGIRQVGIFTHSHSVAATTPTPQKDYDVEKSVDTIYPDIQEVKKYQKSGLNPETALEIHGKLSKAMESERLFNNPELTLPELSQKLDINPNILSQVINTHEGKNFYDYINSLRIADFKNMVLKPETQKYSLLGLAMQCGFNSKTSFNRNFKKATGLSPSEFLRQNNIRLE